MEPQAEVSQPDAGKDRHIYIILNPVAGSASVEDAVRAIEKHFSRPGWTHEIYQTTGQENVAEIAREACRKGAALVAAAGGDGTVAGVVNGLVNSGTPVGIIPVGTGNGLARALQIPLDMEEAVELLAGEHSLRRIHAMQVGESYYVLNVSVGISSRAVRNMRPEEKQRFGMLAYVWTILQELAGYRRPRFRLTLDGHEVEVQAAEVLISNGTVLSQPPFPVGPPEALEDRELEVHLLLARSLADYLRLGWALLWRRDQRQDDLRVLAIKQQARIEVVGQVLPVQADGESIGRTPVEVKLIPGAVTVITPPVKGEN